MCVTYQLTNYSGIVDEWQFSGLSDFNYWVEATTANSVTVVFKTGCNATLKAMLQHSVLATKSVTVPNDIPITSFIAYKHDEWPYDFWLDNIGNWRPGDSAFQRGPRTMEPETSKQHFMAYATRPNTSNPNYSLLKPIYENGFHDGGYAYDEYIYRDFTEYGLKGWIFSEQLPGTVPFCLIEDSEYKDKKMVSMIRYLTQENLSAWRKVSSWYWNWLGTAKKEDRNWTERKNLVRIGYAYPYKPLNKSHSYQ